MTKQKGTIKNRMEAIICDHCQKKIESPGLVGLTLICPHCKRSVNGQYYRDSQRRKNSEDKS